MKQAKELMKKQNQGLKAYQKAALQVIAALAYILLMQAFGNLDTLLHIPFTDRYVDLGILYYVFAMFIIVGVVNSVNLTDGIDGLASTVTLVVFLSTGFINTPVRLLHNPNICENTFHLYQNMKVFSCNNW